MFDCSTLPRSIGIYLMKDQYGFVLYVGKANNIRSRVSQYFNGSDKRYMIPYLLSELSRVDAICTESEYQALILERDLIKKYRPKYNALLKDDKSFSVLQVTLSDKWPKLSMCRYKDMPIGKGIKSWGPYTSTQKAKRLINFALKIFPIRRCSDAEFARRKDPCIYYDMKMCLAPCVGLCSQEEYTQHIKAMCQFLDGKFQDSIKSLEQQIDFACSELAFEKASALDRSVSALLSHASVGSSCKLPENTSGYVFASAVGNQKSIVTVIKYANDRIVDVVNFVLTNILSSKDEIFESWLPEYIERLCACNLVSEDQLNIVVCNYGGDVNWLKRILEEAAGRLINLHTSMNDSYKSICSLAIKTSMSQAGFMNNSNVFVMFENLFGTTGIHRIDCIDSSHHGGECRVSCVVVFYKGSFRRQMYKKFVHEGNGLNDVDSICYAVKKHYEYIFENNENTPDVLIIDGGKQHFHKVHELLLQLGVINPKLVCISKYKGKHSKGLYPEKIIHSASKRAETIDHNSELHRFIQSMRDKAHNESIRCHRNMFSKKASHSVLDEVKGIGKITKMKLLSKYTTLSALKRAILKGECEVNVNKSVLLSLREFFAHIDS